MLIKWQEHGGSRWLCWCTHWMDSVYAGPDQGQVLGESNDSLKDDEASWGQQVQAWLLPYSPMVFRVQYKVREKYPLEDVILGWDS